MASEPTRVGQIDRPQESSGDACRCRHQSDGAKWPFGGRGARQFCSGATARGGGHPSRLARTAWEAVRCTESHLQWGVDWHACPRPCPANCHAGEATFMIGGRGDGPRPAQMLEPNAILHLRSGHVFHSRSGLGSSHDLRYHVSQAVADAGIASGILLEKLSTRPRKTLARPFLTPNEMIWQPDRAGISRFWIR